MLHLQNLTITLGQRLIAQVDTTVHGGEVLTIMGPSGSGKSTLLAAITGTLDPAFAQQGRIILDGQDITALPTEARRIGILFQDDLLFPHLSVGQNLAFGLPKGGNRKERHKTIETALRDVGLQGFANRDPATLSGGQKARVALMRMLLSQPKALLLDEAFSGLDADLREQIRALVFTRARVQNLPVVMVTHDPADAEAAAGPVIHIG
ncbi:ATP-binding cassette domain-containing protein [Donghicola tyrosinivorans]|uniref:Putative thiamine transport system ATP-binding protein n=1 Tax=Donghicola tyrosinivorans TaxID=1652492 RepID=A0A2T0WMH1_9RHOB|nr:ATP-binding cassette domain-containing protein [Donghicola tyrosinivorans]PRY87724.1 putative thiamine transport system ATP-binding protein [Donghicola tyrosinivorans]